MDTKLKNNRKTRTVIVAAVLTVLCIVSICLFPAINQQARVILTRWGEEQRKEWEDTRQIDTDFLAGLYSGCYALNLETVQRQGAQTAADLYLDIKADNSDDNYNTRQAVSWANDRMEAVGREFEEYRSAIDYCIPVGENEYEKNTNQPLEAVLTDSRKKAELEEYYSSYFVLRFDQNGILSIDDVFSSEVEADDIIKELGRIDRSDMVWGDMKDEWETWGGLECSVKRPTDFTVAFGIPKTSVYQVSEIEEYMGGSDYWLGIRACAEGGAVILYVVMLALIAVTVWLMTRRKIWGPELSMERPGRWRLMEAALIGVLFAFNMEDAFVEMIWNADFLESYQTWWEVLNGQSTLALMEMASQLAMMAVGIFAIYAVWYVSLRFLIPVFSLGLREYIRQYSFIYQIFPWVKGKWEELKDEWIHIDFSEKTMRTIRKAVIINFIVLAVISCFWYIGIWFLIAYSVVLFYLLKNYYSRVRKDYQTLLQGVHRIAAGDLESEITEDMGVFEPFKGELAEIQTGFKKAVDEEVKSQRMKTDLITNVSHDLKTPLTAITTYVELLKKEDITGEERKSYIEILEKKSLRLKVLIEDLFEVSKATSNNIVLQLMEVDVINLMKQVATEYADKFEEMGLELRWKLCEEKIILKLDSQKTYRVFENLFVNIQKYAMPNSRVYLEVENVDGWIRIIIKNMSAQELYFKAEEITERFVRGDASRNTEGSGLGLAIAKSFVEAQGGKFHIEVDGDLFKAVIWWKCIEK